jgi:uncharacterized membrane protein
MPQAFLAPQWIPFLLVLHLLGVIVWVGGMFFAHQCLRPVAAAQLEPPQRLTLWVGVLGRFLAWVRVAAPVVVLAGLAMLLNIGFAHAPRHWHAMFLLGLVMFAVYGHVHAAGYPRLRREVAAGNWKAAAAALAMIRRLVGLNILLGLATILIATLGHLF